MIELELTEDRCAVFPLWMWETIHCRVYLTSEPEVFDRWYRELRRAVPGYGDMSKLPEPWRSQLEMSWELMFDRGVDSRCWYHDVALDVQDQDTRHLMENASTMLAAVTPQLCASDTVGVTHFSASSAKSK